MSYNTKKIKLKLWKTHVTIQYKTRKCRRKTEKKTKLINSKTEKIAI